MIYCHRPALLAVLVSSSAALAQTTQPAAAPTTAPAADLSPFASMTGTWVFEGKWSNGNPFKARQLIEPMLGGNFVLVRTWAASNNAAEAERDLTVFGLADGKLVQWVYTPDGLARQSPATPAEGGGYRFDWTKTDAKGKQTELAQIVTPVDPGHYRWKTLMHIKGEWHTLIDGEWKRG